jgi:hypothetical protein
MAINVLGASEWKLLKVAFLLPRFLKSLFIPLDGGQAFVLKV